MTTVDLERVAQVLADVAEQDVLPRWRNLAQGEVREKTGPNDLVTIADEAAERALAARLPAPVTGAVLVGAEGVERDAGLLGLLQGDAPVWILGPRDGPQNISEGSDALAPTVAIG